MKVLNMINKLIQEKIKWDYLEIDNHQNFLSDYNHWIDQWFTWEQVGGNIRLFIYLFILELNGELKEEN